MSARIFFRPTEYEDVLGDTRAGCDCFSISSQKRVQIHWFGELERQKESEWKRELKHLNQTYF